MYHRSTLIFSCLLLAACSSSDQPEANGRKGNNVQRALDTLIAHAKAQERVNSKTSFELADSAWRMANGANDLLHQSEAGSVLLYAAFQLDSITFFNEMEPVVFDLFEQRGNGAPLARHLRRMGDTHYRKGKGTEAKAYYARSLESAFRARAGSELAETYSSIGSLELENGSVEGAITFQRRSLAVLDSIGVDSLPRIRALSNLAQALAWAEEPDSAIFYHNAAIAAIGNKDNKDLLAWNVMNLGTVLIEQGNYEAGQVQLQRAHDEYARSNMQYEVAACLYYLAYCHQHVSLPKQVIHTYQRVITMFDSLAMPHRSMAAHSALGRFLVDLDSARCANTGLDIVERNRLAMTHCRTGLAKARTFNYPYQLADILDATCDMERINGELDSSIAHAKEAILIREGSDLAGRAAGSYVDLGKSLHAKGEFKAAESAFLTGLSQVRASPHVQNEMALHEALQALYGDMGLYAKAYTHLLRSRALTEATSSEAKRQEIVSHDLKWQFDRKQLADSIAGAQQLQAEEDRRAIAELRSERAETRTILIAGGGILLLGAGSVFFGLDRRRRKERYAKQAALLETKALRAQMNPHFIFNALNSISAFIREQQPEKAHGFIARFGRLMRLVLENSRKAEVPLGTDLEALRIYMELEQARTNEKFEFSITVDPGIDVKNVMVPPLVLQPFVENAIWHGMDGKEGQGHIELSIKQLGDQLIMAVSDDGVGRKMTVPVQDTSQKRSLGTTITRERLDLLQKQKGRPAGFQYLEQLVGTRVELTVPI